MLPGRTATDFLFGQIHKIGLHKMILGPVIEGLRLGKRDGDPCIIAVQNLFALIVSTVGNRFLRISTQRRLRSFRHMPQ